MVADVVVVVAGMSPLARAGISTDRRELTAANKQVFKPRAAALRKHGSGREVVIVVSNMAAVLPLAVGTEVPAWEVGVEVRGADEVGVVAIMTRSFSTRASRLTLCSPCGAGRAACGPSSARASAGRCRFCAHWSGC